MNWKELFSKENLSRKFYVRCTRPGQLCVSLTLTVYKKPGNIPAPIVYKITYRVAYTANNLEREREREMEVEKVLHMNGGVGQCSYANNSLLQVSPLYTSLYCLICCEQT